MSQRYNISSTWKGFSTIRRLIIFGDSFSSVDDLQTKVKPDANIPLGVPFPGITWNEPEMPNWVGHLITKYCPEPRYRPSNAGRYGCPVGDKEAQAAWANSPLLVHDYAKGGERVPGVQSQIQGLFLPDVGRKPNWASWTATETLFVTWVGINDCAYATKEGLQDLVEDLLATQKDLYDAGARNFLFIDLPTIHRAPAVRSDFEVIVEEKFQMWNTSLRNAAQEFGKNHPDATVLLFSSFEAFDTFLNKPEEHGFHSEDVKRRNGSIWVDHIHPTSKVHDYIACRLATFLDSIQPVSKEDV